MKKILLFFNFIVFFFKVSSAGDITGGMPGIFLSQGMGARALAMGRAYTSVTNDVNAVYWNPAGLAAMDKKQIEMTHIQLYEDTRYDFIGYGHSIYKKRTNTSGPIIWAFGAGLSQLFSSDFPKRDRFNNPAGLFNDEKNVLFVSAACSPLERYAFGLSGKIINSEIDGLSSYGYGFDFGSTGKVTESINIGLSIKNILPPELKRENMTDVFPLEIRAGVSWEPENYNLIVSVDNELIDNKYSGFHLGFEYKLNIFSLRTGYDLDGFTGGFGIDYSGFVLDYGIFNHPDLGLSHRVSVGYKWGKSIGEHKKEELEELRKNREKEERIKALLQEAETSLSFGEWSIATEKASEILREDNSHKRAHDIKEEVAAQVKKFDMMTNEAFELLKRRNWSEAKNRFKDIIKLYSPEKTERYEKIEGKIKEIAGLRTIAIFSFEASGVSMIEAKNIKDMIEETVINNIREFNVRTLSKEELQNILDDNKIVQCFQDTCIIKVLNIADVKKAITGVVYPDRIKIKILDKDTADTDWTNNIQFDLSNKNEWSIKISQLVDINKIRELLSKSISSEKLFEKDIMDIINEIKGGAK